MKSFRLSPALARSASVIAVAAALTLPYAAVAQTAPPADTQQGTPQADTSPPANQPVAENGATATNANPDTQATDAAGNEITVTGIRASLERSIAIKRNSTGIVDAISAEDIGKFPDTNLAESLQRITGVSIDRRNGEGALVTVRGFGPQFNLVTLNGRQLAATDVATVGGDENADFSAGTSRSFDFDNLASEGVKTLEVYKTGRAAVPSGGIGATINVVTRRPLDSRTSGFNGSIGAKANWDTSADDCVSCGSKVTPEVTGLLSWSNPDQNFGVSLFGSYQSRHFSTASATSNDWNIRTYSDFINPANGFVNANTQINNAPTDSNQLVAVPNDSRYHFADDTRKRINGQAVVQFKPSDAMTFTVDGLYSKLIQKERRSDQSNWFNRPFDVVTFDGNSTIDTTTYLHEVINGATKDTGAEQQYRAQKSDLYDVGANWKWDVTDRFSVALDGHIGRSRSLPDNPDGVSSTLVAISAPILGEHSLDWSSGFPVQTVVYNDAAKGDNNGQVDTGDLGSQVGRTVSSRQQQTIKEARFDGGYDLGGGSRFDFGADYRTSKMHQTELQTQQTLGDWGNAAPRDVEAIAPGIVKQFCLLCKFDKYDPKASGDNLIAFRAEDATQLYDALSDYYVGQGHTVNTTQKADNRVKEDIWSAYGQLTWKGTIADHNASLVAGVRYEHTKSSSLSLQAVPTNILWVSDNDFTVVVDPGGTPDTFTGGGKYGNVLPSMDFQVELARNLIGRVSFSKTIARPDYGNLFPSISVGGPPRPTAIGGTPTANTGTPGLVPLSSDNLDFSLEWYFKPDSYLSVAYFDKRVHNFIGTGQHNSPLFDLKDPSSGQAGTRSGDARTALEALGADITDVNLFTYTALLANQGAAAADTQFRANYDPATRSLKQSFVDSVLAQYDLAGDANDPDYIFNVSQPINNKDANIHGAEFAGQYFFGQTGIGVAAQYTLVRGNVGIDNGADPSVDQFALIGLSDTANVTLIYDKYGISGRLAYNWRDSFLSATNRDSYHNPVYTKPFASLDLNVSYDITPHLAVSVEGVNLTNESVRTYGRTKVETWFAQELKRRFLFGARYRF